MSYPVTDVWRPALAVEDSLNLNRRLVHTNARVRGLRRQGLRLQGARGPPSLHRRGGIFELELEVDGEGAETPALAVSAAEVVGEEETKDQESGERAEMESNVRLADCTV